MGIERSSLSITDPYWSIFICPGVNMWEPVINGCVIWCTYVTSAICQHISGNITTNITDNLIRLYQRLSSHLILTFPCKDIWGNVLGSCSPMQWIKTCFYLLSPLVSNGALGKARVRLRINCSVFFFLDLDRNILRQDLSAVEINSSYASRKYCTISLAHVLMLLNSLGWHNK